MVTFHPMAQSVKITNQTNQSQEFLRIPKIIPKDS